ncbi:hypothetical protein [Algibacter sp. Ld11]|uniref:hypothetical protein n=1 Tax=Algibacter sp. Ld11 TaxID=649150 RepID=UPI00386EC4E1
MKPNRRGQIVKFHTPNYDEDPNDLYLVLEFIEDNDKSRVKMRALNTRYSFPWLSAVYAKDLEVDVLTTKQLERYLEVLKIKKKIDERDLKLLGVECLESLKILS